MQGIIVKGIGGFYYIKTAAGIVECKARGRFRNNNLKPMIGDFVEIDSDKGYILDIEKRKNELIRPPVANVEKTVLVFAARNPDLNLTLMDKFILMCESKGLCVGICINKCDLDDYYNYNIVKEVYEKVGYPVFSASIKDCGYVTAIAEFAAAGKDKVTILSGQSGVGKSTIINSLRPDLEVETGDISQKLKTGKHTTRHVELFELGDCYVADTPGFSTLELDDISREEVKDYYPDFLLFKDSCGFRGCNHIHEPNCAVKEAVENGKINRERYNRYVEIYNELRTISAYQRQTEGKR